MRDEGVSMQNEGVDVHGGIGTVGSDHQDIVEGQVDPLAQRKRRNEIRNMKIDQLRIELQRWAAKGYGAGVEDALASGRVAMQAKLMEIECGLGLCAAVGKRGRIPRRLTEGLVEVETTLPALFPYDSDGGSAKRRETEELHGVTLTDKVMLDADEDNVDASIGLQEPLQPRHEDEDIIRARTTGSGVRGDVEVEEVEADGDDVRGSVGVGNRRTGRRPMGRPRHPIADRLRRKIAALENELAHEKRKRCGDAEYYLAAYKKLVAKDSEGVTLLASQESRCAAFQRGRRNVERVLNQTSARTGMTWAMILYNVDDKKMWVNGTGPLYDYVIQPEITDGLAAMAARQKAPERLGPGEHPNLINVDDEEAEDQGEHIGGLDVPPLHEQRLEVGMGSVQDNGELKVKDLDNQLVLRQEEHVHSVHSSHDEHEHDENDSSHRDEIESDEDDVEVSHEHSHHLQVAHSVDESAQNMEHPGSSHGREQGDPLRLGDRDLSAGTHEQAHVASLYRGDGVLSVPSNDCGHERRHVLKQHITMNREEEEQDDEEHMHDEDEVGSEEEDEEEEIVPLLRVRMSSAE